MRVKFLAFILLASCAVPAQAQRGEPVERRIERLEQGLRQVQRRVFPDGRVQTVDPEIQPVVDQAQPAATGDALGNLVERVNALESQIRALTSQVEEQGFRNRQVEERLDQLQGAVEQRLVALEQRSQAAVEPAPAAVPSAQPEPTEAEPAAADPAGSAAADPAEQAYNAGYRLWNAGNLADAATALEAAATRYPNSRWASWARNLHGRALLDDDKPAAAARVLLANYEGNPRGERAADSLFFLGQALQRLNRRTEACRVYDELERVYPSMRDWIRTRLPQARTAARCTAAE